MDLKLTTAPSVTPHELDAWLRTTEVNDAGSSDVLVDKSFFGIDEITHLSANSNNNCDANNDQGGVEIEAEDCRLVSDISLLGSNGSGDDSADATKDDTRCHCRVSSPLSSNKTCVSTVPDRNGLRRSVSYPHRHGDDENICAAAERSISLVPVDDSSPGQYYCRSLSLPSEHDNGQCSRHDAMGDGVAPISPRSPNHHTRGGNNHHNESVASLVDPSHYFISAMERSRVSQDCIERRFLNNSSQRDMGTMRDSAESRAVVLKMMRRRGNGGGGARYFRSCSHRRSSALDPNSTGNDGGAESRRRPLFRNPYCATRGAHGNKRGSGSSGNVHHHNHHQPRRHDAGTRMHNLRQFQSFDDRYRPPKPMQCSGKNRTKKQLQHQHGDVKAELQRIALEQMMEIVEQQGGCIN